MQSFNHTVMHNVGMLVTLASVIGVSLLGTVSDYHAQNI